jgi:predicted transcriptional regulator
MKRHRRSDIKAHAKPETLDRIQRGSRELDDLIRANVAATDYLFQELDREEREAISARIEEGFQQAERGELTDGEVARRRMQPLKDQFLKARRLGPTR